MATAPPQTTPRRATAAWILYDLANTIFSFNVVTAFFPLWLNQDLGLPDSVFAIGNSVSVALVLLLAPGLGALSDRARRRLPFLLASTVACILPTLFLGWTAWPVAIVLFGVANASFELGLVFYDSLLPEVSNEANRGRIGALGVGFGYFGSFLGLASGIGILSVLGSDQKPFVFVATGLLFLLFSLPIFFVLRERRENTEPVRLSTFFQASRGAYRGLGAILRGRDVPHMGRFLLGRILYTDAANTMIIFMTIYLVNETPFSETGAQFVLLTGITGAFALSPLWGILVDRAGPKKALDAVLLTWMFGLLIVVLVPLLRLPHAAFFPLAFLLGGSLGGTWACDRPLLIALAPRERIGQFFGFYAMMGRFSAIGGPLIWALVVDALGWGRPTAILTLLLFMVAAYAILRGVPDPLRPGPTLFAPYLPWRDAAGIPLPRKRRWALGFPGVALYVVVALAVFFLLYFDPAAPAPDYQGDPGSFWHQLEYHIPRLFDATPQALANLATAIWLNPSLVQTVYVVVLLLLFGAWFEIREGTRRTALVFFATTFVAAILASLALPLLRMEFAGQDWADEAWTRTWGGGSVGAFGLMGALAARARRPWLLMVAFALWEINVGAWYLRSYTPAFHVTALATGFLVTRHGLPPRALACPPEKR